MIAVENSKDTRDLLKDWYNNKGIKYEYFLGENHPMTQDMEWSPALQKVINNWIMAEHEVGYKKIVELPMFLPIGDGMLNSTRQFVGTFTTSIYQLEDNRIGVYLWNRTGLQSGLLHLPIGRQDSDLDQHYYFEEEY